MTKETMARKLDSSISQNRMALEAEDAAGTMEASSEEEEIEIEETMASQNEEGAQELER